MSSQGWIKLHRKLKESPLYKDCNSKQRDILINLLLMVNHKSNKWIFKGEEHEVKAGQVVTSLESIANMCAKDVSVQNVRTALLKFEKHGFLTNKSTNKNRLITIVNWELYQSEEEKQQTKQQAPNKQLTTNKNVKNEKNEIYSRVITRLNGLTSKNFKYTTKKTISYIDSRLKEGFSEQDFYKVIGIKVEEWLNTDMAKYLRPETLFGAKFESYLNQSLNNIDEEKSKGKVLDFKIGGE
ncbi:conserved phage C-terminal domain-containing protein [Paraclostridium bifermentans]|nr:conserved phage C-terminal domain-containing protein [Paraclostridium bifermentans]